MASSSSSPSSTIVLPSKKRAEPTISWSDLPQELIFSILIRLSVAERLETAQKVCRSWRLICKDPLMWQKLNLRKLETMNDNDHEAMCRHAIDRSQGGLLEITIDGFDSDDLLPYIAQRSSNLRSLALPLCYSLFQKIPLKAIAKLSCLKELEIKHSCPKLNYKAIGYSCPQLKILKVNCLRYRWSWKKSDGDALAIAETMPRLRHLQLLGNRLTEIGLKAILDNCPHLEHLDLRKCINVNFEGNLEKRCSERIKVLRLPNDSIADYSFDSSFDNYLLFNGTNVEGVHIDIDVGIDWDIGIWDNLFESV